MHRCLHFLLFLVPFCSSNAQELPFRHYTTDDPVAPLPANGVTEIYQDDVGYLWFALSGAGLVRYDGRTMERFRTEDGLSDLNVDGIVQDTTGRLWVTSYGGLSVSERPIGTYRLDERPRFTGRYCGVDLIDRWVTGADIVADDAGGVWIGTDDFGVLRYSCTEAGASVDTFSTALESEGEDQGVYAISLDGDGSLWATLSGGTLLKLPAARHPRRFEIAVEGLLDATTTSLALDAKGTLWGGTYNGRVWRLNTTGGTASDWQALDVNLGHWIRSIKTDVKGVTWIASSGGGLLRVDGNEMRRIGRRDGLLSETVYGLGTDLEGNLYVGQNQGVSKLPPDYEAFAYYTATSHVGEQPVLPASSVSAVLESDNRLWIGTPGGLVTIGPDAGPHIVGAEDGLPTNELYALGRGADGSIWIGLNGQTTALHPPGIRPPTLGTTESATFSLGGRPWRATSFRLFNVYAIRDLRLPGSAIDTARVPTQWFTSYMKLACLIDDEWFTFRQAAGYPPTASSAAAVDEGGYVWFATDDHGLYRSRMPLSPDSIRAMHARSSGERDAGREIVVPVFEAVWTTENGSPTNNIQNLIFHRGKLWIGTPVGLFAASPLLNDVVQVDGLSNQSVVSLSAADRSVWVGTNSGLVEVDADSVVARQTLHHIDGLLNDETSFINSVFTTADGEVLYGSAKGLTVYRPALDRKNEIAPRLALRDAEFQVQGWGRSRFVAEYAALSFDRESAVRYRTRLRGYEDTWSDEKADGRFQITNLPALLIPRQYTFEVIARNADGAWSESPMRHAFTVQPAWFASWWFVLVVLGALGGGVHLVYKSRVRRERMRHEIESARSIQRKLQPAAPLRERRVEIAGACMPAYEVGGDHFDYRRVEAGLLVVLTDVEGKRMEGAFQAAVVRGMLSSAFEHSEALPDVAAQLNHMIYDALGRETAVAMLVATLDPIDGVLRILNAGCQPPLHSGGGDAMHIRTSRSFPPLGKIRSVTFETAEVAVAPGQVVVFVSDGITEATDGDGRPYRERMAETVARNHHQSAETLVKMILDDVERFTGSRVPDDDRTVVVLRML